MKREKITISDSGAVTVPNEVKMGICEIADLFGIYYQTAKRHIRAIEKSGVAGGDYSMCCTAVGKNVCPEYYGLEMIVAIAFRLQSRNAMLLREWVMKRLDGQDITATLKVSLQNAWLN
jgi:hypothetical protein